MNKDKAKDTEQSFVPKLIKGDHNVTFGVLDFFEETRMLSSKKFNFHNLKYLYRLFKIICAFDCSYHKLFL